MPVDIDTMASDPVTLPILTGTTPIWGRLYPGCPDEPTLRVLEASRGWYETYIVQGTPQDDARADYYSTSPVVHGETMTLTLTLSSTESERTNSEASVTQTVTWYDQTYDTTIVVNGDAPADEYRLWKEGQEYQIPEAAVSDVSQTVTYTLDGIAFVAGQPNIASGTVTFGLDPVNPATDVGVHPFSIKVCITIQGDAEALCEYSQQYQLIVNDPCEDTNIVPFTVGDVAPVPWETLVPLTPVRDNRPWPIENTVINELESSYFDRTCGSDRMQFFTNDDNRDEITWISLDGSSGDIGIDAQSSTTPLGDYSVIIYTYVEGYENSSKFETIFNFEVVKCESAGGSLSIGTPTGSHIYEMAKETLNGPEDYTVAAYSLSPPGAASC
jgi:hypothetical protein